MKNSPTNGDKNGQNRAVVMTGTMTHYRGSDKKSEYHKRTWSVWYNQILKAQDLCLKVVRLNFGKDVSRKSARLNSMACAGENILKQVSFSVSSTRTFQASHLGGF